MSSKQKLILSIVSGLLYLMSFPPLPFGFLAPFALALLLPIAFTSTRKQTFLYYFISGVVFNTGLLYWIPRLMQEGLYVVLALGMVLLIGYMAFWVGLTGLSIHFIRLKSRILALALFPFIWTAQEKIRELGEMSFPWVTVGYTYGGYTPLIQFASVLGVYFYSFLIALTAVLLFLIFEYRKDAKRIIRFSAILIGLYGFLTIHGLFRIKEPSREHQLKVALVQANVDQNVKWNVHFRDSVYNLHKQMTLQCVRENPDLVVWSESAMPCYFLKRPRYKYGVITLMDSLSLPLVFGGLDYMPNYEKKKKYDFFNSVFFYHPKSRRFLKYDKIRLVPFSERLPFEGIFPLISRVDLGEADFTPGRDYRLFKLKGYRLFTPVCYEVVYPKEIRRFVRSGGEFMVHLTNDGWFGRSGMPFQHANITRFRALENGIWVARCANTGVSCFIDPYGRFTKKSSIFTGVNIVGNINARGINTFYTRHGDLMGWFCIWVTVLYFLFVFGKWIYIKKYGKKS
jgi:apolipoprotein N-acyltransferase